MRFYFDAQSLRDSGMTVVKDVHNHPAYILNGRRGLLSDGGFNLHALDGTLMGEIRPRNVRIFPQYDLSIAGGRVGSLRKVLGVWHEIVYVTGLNWIISGNILVNEYHIYHRMKAISSIATVSHSAGTVFQIDFAVERDVAAGLLIAATLDRWRQNHARNPLVRHEEGIEYGF